MAHSLPEKKLYYYYYYYTTTMQEVCQPFPCPNRVTLTPVTLTGGYHNTPTLKEH